MEEKPSSANMVKLISPEHCPFKFNVEITDAVPGESYKTTFDITGTDQKNGKQHTFVYTIENRDHSSYLNLFENLANDFGLRLPQNRQIKLGYSFSTTYQELLT